MIYAKSVRNTRKPQVQVSQNAHATQTTTEQLMIPRICHAHVSIHFIPSKHPNNFTKFIFAEPPSAPQNLTSNFVDQSTVMLSWSPPERLGGRTDTVYRIKCDACAAGIVQYTPNAVSIQNYSFLLIVKESKLYLKELPMYFFFLIYRRSSTILRLRSPD